MTDLDSEEKEILEAYQAGRLEPLALSREDVEGYRAAARAVSRKDKRINIRVPAPDLERLQVRAMQEGLPYQSLIASILHKYVTGQLVAKA
jgi:predicted DNA binding CopG/RHH family protein